MASCQKVNNYQDHRKNIMIQNQSSIEYYKEHEELTKQITEYKRINASLKKKIQARDKKISYLFACVDPMSKSSIQATLETGTIKKNRSEIDSSLTAKKEVCLTESKHKQKQNLGYHHHNIFKERGLDYGNGQQRVNFKLPTLQRRSIFAENPEIMESKPRIVKISIQKLIPLKPQDVKKKYESQFK